MARRHGWISDVRGLGLYFGVEIGQRGEPDGIAAAERLLYRCLEAGLSFKLGGGNVVTLCPPLTIGPTRARSRARYSGGSGRRPALADMMGSRARSAWNRWADGEQMEP